MKTTEKLLLTGAAAVTLLFGGCTGDYYGPYEGPYYGGTISTDKALALDIFTTRTPTTGVTIAQISRRSRCIFEQMPVGECRGG
jgi:hypothetical protein